MVKENIPPALGRDGLRLFTWKNVKGILGTKAGQRTIIGMCQLFEKVFPRPAILWRLYRLAISGAIYRGFNEGLKFFQVDTKTLARKLPK